jgi:hypothetical protein
MTLRELKTRRELMAPAQRRDAILNCRVEGRHELTATPAQLRRLAVLAAGPLPVFEWRYCRQCWAVFGPDGHEIDGRILNAE